MRRRTKAIMTIPNSRFLATRAKIPSVDDVFKQSDLDFHSKFNQIGRNSVSTAKESEGI